MGDRVGVLLIGVAGAVATTVAAGLDAIRSGRNALDGLPLAGVSVTGLPAYRDLVVAGWDVSDEPLDVAARRHRVLEPAEIDAAPTLAARRAWPAVADRRFSPLIDGPNRIAARGHRYAIDCIRADIERFRDEHGTERLVVINLASTERLPPAEACCLRSLDAFERGLDRDDEVIGPAMLYAYAAIASGVPYANFTPSLAADAGPLVEMAEAARVPIAGKDGKTGQTLLKTVIAPALRDRALHVDGWFSTNVLGNSDGLALTDEGARAAKLATKRDVLEELLGYPVPDHLVAIHYYPPRGDDKEAWDSIDVTGFLGKRMQIKLNMLFKDSVLAAPLVIELARLLDLARQRREAGVQEQLGAFFKSPQTRDGHAVEHAFAKQQRRLEAWLAGG